MELLFTIKDGVQIADLIGNWNNISLQLKVALVVSETLHCHPLSVVHLVLHCLGEPGEERTLILELKSVADIALVRISKCWKILFDCSGFCCCVQRLLIIHLRPWFQTLGVVQAGETRFTVADVPGLIPGASQGKGLGLEFLRHVERCVALVHVTRLRNVRDTIATPLQILKQLKMS